MSAVLHFLVTEGRLYVGPIISFGTAIPATALAYSGDPLQYSGDYITFAG